MLSISSLLEILLPQDPLVGAAMGAGGLLSLSVFLYWVMSSKHRSTDKLDAMRKVHRLKSTLPLLGDTLELVKAVGNMHDWTTQLCKHFKGEPFMMRSLGAPDRTIVCNPQVVEDVLKNQFENFPKGPFMCERLRDILGDGIFSVDGDKWVHQRKTASRLFTMRALRESMTSTIQRHAEVLHAILRRASESNETLDLFKLFNRFTIEAFAEIGFGVQMGCLDTEEEHPFQTAFDRAQRAVVHRFVRPRWFWRAQRWLGVGAEGQLRRDIKVIDSTVLEIVKQALEKRTNASGMERRLGGLDIVSLFLDNFDDSPEASEKKFDPVYLRDIVVNFLIAGRDTTAQALSWFFWNVSKSPAIEGRIRKEIFDKLPALMTGEITTPTMEQAKDLVYLEAALKETLRLHPSVPASPKHAVEDTVLSDGTFIAANSSVILPFYAMGRMTHIWGPDAEEFKPERWIDSATGKLVSVPASKFVAFNGGPRVCLGMNLAMLEMKLVAAGLLSRFHVEVQRPEDVTYDFSLTLPVKGALDAKVSRASLSAFA